MVMMIVMAVVVFAGFSFALSLHHFAESWRVIVLSLLPSFWIEYIRLQVGAILFDVEGFDELLTNPWIPILATILNARVEIASFRLKPDFLRKEIIHFGFEPL